MKYPMGILLTFLANIQRVSKNCYPAYLKNKGLAGHWAIDLSTSKRLESKGYKNLRKNTTHANVLSKECDCIL